MLKDAAVDKALAEATISLAGWAEEVAGGRVAPRMAIDVQNLRDVLVCLLEEANERYRVRIDYLIDRAEVLAGRLAN